MTQEELIKEFSQLPPDDQKALLDVMLEIVRDETKPSGAKSIVERLHGIAKPEFGTRDELHDSQSPSLSQRLYGVLQFDGEPPNDEEVKDLIADYLIRKYS